MEDERLRTDCVSLAIVRKFLAKGDMAMKTLLMADLQYDHNSVFSVGNVRVSSVLSISCLNFAASSPSGMPSSSGNSKDSQPLGVQLRAAFNCDTALLYLIVTGPTGPEGSP